MNNSWPNFSLLVLVAVMAALVADSQLHPAHSFFQSPAQSPVSSTPTNTPLPPTDTPAPLPTDTPVPAQPINTPPPQADANPLVEAQSSEPPAPEGDTGAATVEAIPIELPQAIPNAPAAGQQPPQPLPLPQVAQEDPTPPVPAEPTIVTNSGADGAEEPQADVVINQAALIDVIVQWLASLWLCIGVGVILLIPLIFLYLQVRGARLRRY